MIDLEDDRLVCPIARRGDEHAFCSRTNVRLGLLPGCEEARAFERHVNTKLIMGQVCWIAFRRHPDFTGPDVDPVFAEVDRSTKGTMNRVVPQKVRQGSDRPEVVDRNHFDVLST